MRDSLTKILSIAIVLLVAVIINSVATLSLTDLGTYDNSPKKQKDVINANNALIETAVNANLATGTANTALITAISDTNAVPDTTSYTPRYVGEILVGSASNQVWVATGATTSDWALVTN